MVLSQRLARINRRLSNPILRHLVGIGPFAELEHVGRSSGRRYRTVLMAFRRGDTMTIALTYGPDVDWLKNIRAAGGGRLRFRRDLLELGAPRPLTTAQGLSRMPIGPRQLLPLAGVDEFIELSVLGERRPRR